MKTKAVTYEVTFNAKPTVTLYLPSDFDMSDEERIKERIFEALYTDLEDYIQPYNFDAKAIREKELNDDWD